MEKGAGGEKEEPGSQSGNIALARKKEIKTATPKATSGESPAESNLREEYGARVIFGPISSFWVHSFHCLLSLDFPTPLLPSFPLVAESLTMFSSTRAALRGASSPSLRHIFASSQRQSLAQTCTRPAGKPCRSADASDFHQRHC